MKHHRFLVEVLDHIDLFERFSAGRVKKQPFYRFPFITWPNGTPCLIANLYLLQLSKKHPQISADGRRHDSKGGTIGQYASYISQLIRRCWILKTDPYHITDKFFEDFIIDLIEEINIKHPMKRKKLDTTTINIGRVCLNFLEWVGQFHGDPNFVSANGTIRASITETVRNFNNQNKITQQRGHHSFPLPHREHTRSPIPDHNIKKIENAITNSNYSLFRKARDQAVITLLQHTGARRVEIASITLSSTREAMLMKYPMLKLVTVKRGEVFIREVPINTIALNDVKMYISVRAKLANSFPHSKNDFLFISETTGHPIAVETIGSGISKIRIAAGIEEQACAHMFRHAFISNLFTLLIERHKFESKDEFENALINDEVFLKKVQEWTGHKSLRSLRTYLTQVFSYDKTVNKTVYGVHETQTLKLYQRKADTLICKLKEGKISPEQFLLESEELQALRDHELARYA